MATIVETCLVLGSHDCLEVNSVVDKYCRLRTLFLHRRQDSKTVTAEFYIMPSGKFVKFIDQVSPKSIAASLPRRMLVDMKRLAVAEHYRFQDDKHQRQVIDIAV